MYGLTIVIVIIVISIIIRLWLFTSRSASFPVITFCAPLGGRVSEGFKMSWIKMPGNEKTL